MALIKKRPKIRVHLPPEVTPGERFVAQIEIVADRPVPANAVTIALLGEMSGDPRAARAGAGRVLVAAPGRAPGGATLHR